MDNFITLIVVIIFIVSAISRIKAAQKPKGGAKPAPPNELGTKLKAFFAEIQKRLEEQAPNGSSGASHWDRLAKVDKSDQSPSPSYEMSLDDLELDDEEEIPLPEPVKKQPSRPVKVRAKPMGKRPIGGGSRSYVPEPLSAQAAPCPEFLRRAIVWSEILGPPAALRDSTWDR
jgi:hypothetical protein